MLPEVAELALLLAHDEEGGTRAESAPASPSHAPQLRQGGCEAADDCLTSFQLDLDDAVRVLRISAVSEVFDDEGPGVGDGEERFTRPLVNDVWWAHHDRGVGLVAGVHMDRAQRHEGLPCPALGHNTGRASGFQVLGQARDGEGLGGQGGAEQRVQTGCGLVFRRLERGIGLHDARAQFGSHRAQVVEVGFHDGSPEVSEWAKEKASLRAGLLHV